MIPVLEAISNSVSGLPAATAAGPSLSRQGGLSGFASALDAARGLSTAAQTAAGEVEASAGSSAANGGAAPNPNVRMPDPGNPPTKKALNGTPPAALSTAAVMNSVVPGVSAMTASQVLLPQPGLLQPVLSSTLTASAAAQTPKVVAGSDPSVLPATAYNAPPQSTPSGYSALNQTAEIFPPPTSPNGTLGRQTGPSTSGALMPNEIDSHANGQAAAIANSAQFAAASTAAVQPAANGGLPNLASGAAWNIAQDGLASAEPMRVVSPQPHALSTPAAEPSSSDSLLTAAPGNAWNSSGDGLASADPILLAESTQPTVVSTVTGGPASGAAGLNVTADTQTSGSQTDGPEVDSPGFDGSRLGARQSIAQANQSTESQAPALTLLANANPGAGTAPGALPAAAANLQSTDPAAQADPATTTGAGAALSGIINAQIAAAAILNSSGQAAPGGTALRFAAPRVAPAVTGQSVRGAAPGAGARMSILASAAPPGSGSGSESPPASQTPFSVFFSGPGPGTESAASALPRMILPGMSSAMRNSPTTGTGASPQSNGMPTGGTQNAVLQNPKESSTTTGSGSLPAGAFLHQDAALTAASAQTVSSPTAAVPVSAPLASAGAALPLAGQTALLADSPPKADTVPGGAPGSAANLEPAAPQTPPAAVPGPVQVAQMVSRLGQSEMRIGMNTSAFGSVEVRTVVHANDVGLVIGSEKGDLRTLLANDMPAITNTLQQQNLRLNSVNFMQGFAFSNNASGGGDSQQRSFVPLRPAANSLSSEAAGSDSPEPLPAGEYGGGVSLSILA